MSIEHSLTGSRFDGVPHQTRTKTFVTPGHMSKCINFTER